MQTRRERMQSVLSVAVIQVWPGHFSALAQNNNAAPGNANMASSTEFVSCKAHSKGILGSDRTCMVQRLAYCCSISRFICTSLAKRCRSELSLFTSESKSVDACKKKVFQVYHQIIQAFLQNRRRQSTSAAAQSSASSPQSPNQVDACKKDLLPGLSFTSSSGKSQASTAKTEVFGVVAHCFSTQAR